MPDANTKEEMPRLDQLIVMGEASADTSVVEFLRTGTFTDANGREVKITAKHLDALIANFENGAAGQDVPIDVVHERREAAGWVRRIFRAGEILKAEVEWNDLGRQLLGQKIYRYLSATIDLGRDVLRSISLVNFPAVKGLQPAELAEAYLAPDVASVQDAESDAVEPQQPDSEPTNESHETAAPVAQHQPEVTMTEEIKDQVEEAVVVETQEPTTEPQSALITDADLAEIRAQLQSEFSQTLKAELARLEASKQREMARMIESLQDERALAEFCDRITGEGRHALPVSAATVNDVLADLAKPQRKRVMELLDTIYTSGTVDFTERGTANGATKVPLPEDYARALKSHLASGGSVDVFFEANALDKRQYDLEAYNG